MSDHATTMYALRPIVTLPAIYPSSKTMYEMQNIHEDEREGRRRHHDADTDAKMPDDVITEQKPLPEYSALEIRQEKILNQLTELKKQVSTLCHFLKRSKTVTNEPSMPKKAVNLILIIKVDPEEIPYSICALQKLWKDTDFRITTYKHSTVQQEVPECFPTHIISATKNVVNIIIIWKKVPQLEVFTELQTEPLIGEVNLLRYLYRMIDSCEDDYMQTYRMDSILDLCYIANCQRSRANQILHTLSDTLDEWSGKDKPNIADIAVWSMYKNSVSVIRSDPFAKWNKMYNKMFMYKNN